MKVAPLAPPGLPIVVGNYGEWFTLKLAGTALPGKWTLPAGAIALKEDVKKKAGVDGGNPVFHGLTSQRFEAVGEQFNDVERQGVADAFVQLVPQPGQSQNQYPVQLEHPAAAVIPFAIFVKILGCSVFEHVGPCITRVRLFMRHWLPEQRNAASATNQPTRAVRNNRTGSPTPTPGPTPPSQQPGAFGPPNITQ